MGGGGGMTNCIIGAKEQNIVHLISEGANQQVQDALRWRWKTDQGQSQDENVAEGIVDG